MKRVLTKNKSRNLSPIPDNDVYELQRFLESKGYGKFYLGGFFGKNTQSWLAAFQRDEIIKPALGNLGSETRRRINLMNFPKQKIFHAIAVSLLGVDASPRDRAPDELACADTVNMIALEALGYEIGGTVSTIGLNQAMLSQPDKYRQTKEVKEGSIVMYPTKGKKVGHVLIADKPVGNTFQLMSNSSSTSLFTRNYTLEQARNYWVKGKGLKEYIYDII